jgi:hypothetical protein
VETCCAKLAKSARSSASYSPELCVSAAVVIVGDASAAVPVRACVAAQRGDQRLDHLSVGLNGFFSAAAGSALLSTSRSMSISILVARNSAEADLLTSFGR